MTLSTKARIALKRAMFTNPNMAGEICDAIDGRVRSQECRGATIAAGNLNLTTTGLTAIDGVTPVAGDHWLVKNQSTASQNGLWVAAVGAWTRVKDGASVAITLIEGMVATVAEGTVNAGTQWILGADLTTWTEAGVSAATPTALGVAATGGVGLRFSADDHVHAWSQKRTVVLGHAMTGSADTNGTPNTPIAIGAALPARAIVVAIETVVTTSAGGSTSAQLDVGWSGAQDVLTDGFDLFGAPASYDQNGGAGTNVLKFPVQAGGKTLTFIVTPDSGKKLSEMTLLVGAINVYFVVPF